MKNPLAAASFATFLLTFGASGAVADETGTPGRLVAVAHVDDNSDDYNVFRGRFYLDSGADSLDKYYWGGTLCGGRDLTVEQQHLLFDALRLKKATVVPLWKTGMAGVRCSVGFTILNTAKAIPLL
jgi:hypothetical protein